jgi:hypothetical protein
VKTLELADLVRLTRITVDLNRIMAAQRKRAEQLGERSRQAPPAAPPTAQPKSQRLSDEVSRTMLNALLATHSIAPTETLAPPAPETTAVPTKSVSNNSMPAKAQPSAPESRPRSSPHLTALLRIESIGRLPLYTIIHSVWPPVVGPKLPSPRHQAVDKPAISGEGRGERACSSLPLAAEITEH